MQELFLTVFMLKIQILELLFMEIFREPVISIVLFRELYLTIQIQQQALIFQVFQVIMTEQELA